MYMRGKDEREEEERQEEVNFHVQLFRFIEV